MASLAARVGRAGSAVSLGLLQLLTDYFPRTCSRLLLTSTLLDRRNLDGGNDAGELDIEKPDRIAL